MLRPLRVSTAIAIGRAAERFPQAPASAFCCRVMPRLRLMLFTVRFGCSELLRRAGQMTVYSTCGLYSATLFVRGHIGGFHPLVELLGGYKTQLQRRFTEA